MLERIAVPRSGLPRYALPELSVGGVRQATLNVQYSSVTVTSQSPSVTQHQTLEIQSSSIVTTSQSPSVIHRQTLEIQSSSVISTSQSPSVIQHQNLAVGSSLVFIESLSPSLVQHQTLEIQSSSIIATSQSPSVTQHQNLAVGSSVIFIESLSPSLVQHQVMEIQSSSIVTTSQSPSVTQNQNPVVGSSVIFIESLSPSLAQHQAMEIQSASIVITSQSPSVIQHQVLVEIQSSSIVTTSQSPSVTQHQTLETRSSSIISISQSPSVIQHQTLEIQSSSIIAISQSPSVIQHQNLAVGSSVIFIESLSPSLVQRQTLEIQSSSVVITSQSPSVTQHQTLSEIQSSSIIATSQSPSVIHHQTLEIQSSSVVITSQSPSVTQHQNLAVGSSVIFIESLSPSLVQHQVLIAQDSVCAYTSGSPVLREHEHLFITHPYGRRPTGVDQQAGGGKCFPLLRPSFDVEGLIADLHLVLSSSPTEIDWPLRVAWLSGFGDNVVAHPVGAPDKYSWMDYEILILDSSDRTVFRPETLPQVFDHFGRLRVVSWTSFGGRGSCTLLYNLAWTQDDVDAGVAHDYDSEIVPDNGELDADAVHFLPNQVWSIGPTASSLSGDVGLLSGYNMQMGVEPVDAADLARSDLEGISTVKPITVLHRSVSIIGKAVVPGSGPGRSPGCELATTDLLQINHIGGDGLGNIKLLTDACLRLQRPMTQISESPRQFRYYHPNLSNDEAAAALVVYNDCGPCCSCDEYAAVYMALSRQWSRWKTVAEFGKNAQAFYDQLITTWNDNKSCREDRVLQVRLLPEDRSRLQISIGYCNFSALCRPSLEIRLTFMTYFDGLPADLHGRDLLKTVISAEARATIRTLALAGSWPVFSVVLPYVNPQEFVRLAGKMAVSMVSRAGDVNQYSAAAFISVHYPDDGVETLPLAVVPPELLLRWQECSVGPPEYPARHVYQTFAVPLM